MIEIRHSAELDSKLLSKIEKCWSAVLARKDVGFPLIPSRDENWKQLEERLEQVGHQKRLIVIGIGGSSLGTQVIYQAFRSPSATEIFFLESPDPAKWTELASKGPDWRDAHIIIVSKSGGTLETLSWVEKLSAQDPSWLKTENCTLIASPGSGALQVWAKKEKIKTLLIPEDVGGRFSVLTAAGMFPSGLMGLSLFDFRKGAEWALENPEVSFQMTAAILNSWKTEHTLTQMWTYSESLRDFGLWWQQLWGESLAKKTTRAGLAAPRASTPMCCLGPRDQHSLVQQLNEGPRDKYVLLMRVKALEISDESFTPSLFPEAAFFNKPASLGKVLGVEATAFEQSLVEQKIAYSAIELEGITEQGLGAMFMFWQMVVAQLGEHMEINAFDQPGVELGKRHADRILRQ